MDTAGAGEAPATSPSLTKVHIVSRSRSGSSSSLELDNTQSFYGIRRTPSQERYSRPTSPPVTPSQPATSSNPRSPSAHSASILPAASFFNPKRATALSTTARPLSPGATPTSNDNSAAAHNWRFSTVPSLGTGGDSQEPQQHITQRRVGNGPLITRISAAVDYGTPSSATTSFPPPASSSAGRAGGRKYSSGGDMSDEDVEQDLARGGLSAARLARINRSGSQERGFGGSRTSLEQLGSGAGATAGSMGRQSFDVDDPASSVGHGQRDSSDFTFGAPPIVPTPQASRDHLVTSPDSNNRIQQYPTGSARLNDYPEGNGSGNKEGAIARARASISGSPRSSPREDQGAWSPTQAGVSRRTGGGVQLMDVETSGEYERELKPSGAAPRASTSAANLPKAQHTRVEIPTRPLVDAQGRKVRNYQLHEGSNRFYLRGRVLSSQDNPIPFILSLALAVVMPILFFAFSGPFLWSHLGGGGKASIFIFVYMCLVMWSSMCKTAWRDPGIVPRALDLTPQRKWVDDLHGEGQGGWRAEPKYMRIGEGVVSSKWCETCETYRPPRTSHCRLCDNCIEHTDHHCTFLNNCIGRRNYTSFVAFLVAAIFCAIYALSFSSWHIARRHALSTNPSSSEFGSAWASRWDVVGSFVVAILSFALLCPIAGLMGYHMKLLWVNRTTIENLRPKTDRSGAINPADGQPMGNLYALSSPFSNIVSRLCRPMEIPSYIEPHRYALKDLREEQQAAREKGNADGAV